MISFKNISNEDKKQLFLKLIDECDKGNTQRFDRDGNVFRDAGYFNYGDGWKIKNNGILGLWYAGLDEEGKHVIQLVAGGSLEERDSALFDISKKSAFIRSFSDSELNEFLDKFFDMNNIQALNEFCNTEYFKENEKYETPYANFTKNSLEYLNIMDYINAISERIDIQNEGVTGFELGDRFLGNYIEMAKIQDGFRIVCKKQGDDYRETAYFKFQQNRENLKYELVEKDGDDKEVESILAVVNKAIDDVPSIYQHLRNGTYQMEEFLLKSEMNKKGKEIEKNYIDKKMNKLKKELFMSMVEKAKEGTLDMMLMTDSEKYDEIYSQLINNHGPFGIVIAGITKEGKVSVYLSDSMVDQEASYMGSSTGFGTLIFNESELNDFLDKFYDMNNMEILNEFYKNPENAPDYFKNISLEEYKNNEHNLYYAKLAILNGLDYLNNDKTGKLTVRSNCNYGFENGLEVLLDREFDKIIIGMGEEFMTYNLRNGQIENQTKNFENSECSQYASLFLQSVDSLPKVYESILNGQYKKENFIHIKNNSLLQQKEDELSSLEAEEKTISEAEALIKKEMDEKEKDLGE